MSLRFYPIYKLTEVKQQVLKDFVRENLQLKRIRLLQSLAGYPVLFILKKNKKFKMCINYRQLNSIIKKY
jgi:Na+-transporting NADH:ubiquinone oxidoreductase subunit NqrB